MNVLRIARAEEDLGLVDPQLPDKQLIEVSAQLHLRFHGSVPAMIEEVKKLTAQGQRVIFAAPNTGEMERLADIFTEYQVPFRLGTRTPVAGSETYLDETAYFSGDLTYHHHRSRHRAGRRGLAGIASGHLRRARSV